MTWAIGMVPIGPRGRKERVMNTTLNPVSTKVLTSAVAALALNVLFLAGGIKALGTLPPDHSIAARELAAIHAVQHDAQVRVAVLVH
jgi:hypothetical protein